MSLREYEMVIKTVADPARLRILKLLEGGEMCVCQVVAVLELSQSTISRHLSLMKRAGLVRERQEKKWVFYDQDVSGGNRYARKMIAAVKGWMNDDPVILRDRRREALARKIGPVEISGRGMTLRSRRSVPCCRAHETVAVGSK